MALPFDGNDASVVVDLAPASPRASQHRTPAHSALMSNMHDHSGRSRATLRTVSSLQSMASHASSTGGVSSHRSHKPGSHRRGSDGSMKIRQREPMVRTDPWHARSRRDGSEPPSDVAVRLRHADASPVARRSPKLGAPDLDAFGDSRGYEAGIGGSGRGHTPTAAATVAESVVVRQRVLRQSSSVDSRPGIADLPLYRSHRPTASSLRLRCTRRSWCACTGAAVVRAAHWERQRRPPSFFPAYLPTHHLCAQERVAGRAQRQGGQGAHEAPGL